MLNAFSCVLLQSQCQKGFSEITILLVKTFLTMLLRNDLSQYLIKFSERLEEKELVSSETAGKIRKYVRSETSPVSWKVFLVFGGIFGALSVSAGVYSIISHNWYDFPVWLRGVFSFVPAGVALFFYYLMLSKHSTSKVWIEASSLFLMLMIGASIATASQTYHLGGDYEDFIFTMLLATIPLFYISRASVIALFYLLLALVYLVLDIRINFSFNGSIIDFGSNSVWFWIFVLALLPHYYMTLNRGKKEQGIRFMFLTLILYFFVYWALMASVDSNRLLWSLIYNVGFYLFAKRYMDNHFWFLQRFMSWLPQIAIALTLLSVSNRFVLNNIFQFDSFLETDDWTGGEWYYFILLVVVIAGVYFNYFKGRQHYENCNQMIVFAPGLIIFLILFNSFLDLISLEAWWPLSLIINLYIFFVAVVTMVNGSEEGRFIKVLAGLVLITLLVINRYFDVSMGFIWKGLLFMAFGGMFFLINMFVKEKVDQIQRNKKQADGE